MNEMYAEVSVKRRETPGTYALRVLLIFIAIVSFLFTFQNSILLFISAILIVAIIYIFPRLNVEYEYVYCDGQLDFDKIMGNSKRKTALKIDFEKVDILAPEGSHALDGYTHVKSTVKDFTSRRKDVKPYVIVLREGEMATKILFEPNEKIINMIKMKYPRKIAQY